MDSDAGDGPDPAAIDRVRRDLAELGSDESSAPDVPAAVTARVGAALRAAPGHAARRSVPRRRLQIFGLVIGVGATVVAVALGGVMLARDPAPTRSAGPTAESITVSRPPRNIPLSNRQIVGLLSQRPDYGPLADPQRRASCLSGLGYSAVTKVLGARPVDMYGRPGVLMLLPRRHAQGGRGPGRRVELQFSSHRPAYRHRGHSSVICASGRRGTPGPTLLFVLVPQRSRVLPVPSRQKGPHDLHTHRS